MRIMLLAIGLLLLPAHGHAQGFPPQFKGIGIDQKLNEQLPLDAVFRDQNGASVPLRTYFGTRPVLLVPVYYNCSTLCSQVLSGVVEGLSPLQGRAGRDFEVVAFSFDPAETPADARKKLGECGMNYAGRPDPPGWHFLTGSADSIRRLTAAIGFQYRYDAATKMFVHATAIMAITPQGRVARYFYGVVYEPRDLRQGLLDAAAQRSAPSPGLLRLLCYAYNPANGKYGSLVVRALRVAAALTLLFILGGLALLWRSDLRQRNGKEPPRRAAQW